MKATKVFGVLLCSVLFLFPSCKKSTSGDNSRNALDWKGVYTGVVPCADCEGIQTTVVLNDGSYELRTKYLGKSVEEVLQKDTFMWNDAGSEITLYGVDARTAPTKYRVGENKLIQLDMEGKRMKTDVEPAYTLTKVSDVVEKYWKLVELKGEEVAVSEEMMREPHFTLKVANARVQGNGGCNSFFGTYTIRPEGRISFSQMGSTMMACPAMDVEYRFMQLLGEVQAYEVAGDTLTLYDKDMQPSAKLAAVYL